MSRSLIKWVMDKFLLPLVVGIIGTLIVVIVGPHRVAELLKWALVATLLGGVLTLIILRQRFARRLRRISVVLGTSLVVSTYILLAVLSAVLLRHWADTKKGFIVALAKFHPITSGAEEYQQSVMHHLAEELNKHGDAVDYILCPAVKDSGEAQQLGKDRKAHLVVWGNIESIADEVYIEPHIDVTHHDGTTQLKPREPPSESEVFFSEPGRVKFVKRKAREISDLLLFILGSAKYQKQAYLEAIEILDKVAPPNYEILLLVGNAHRFRVPPEYDSAEAKYRQALAENPDGFLAHNNLANILLEQGWLREAADQYEAGLRTAVEDAVLHNNFGVVLADLTEHAASEIQLREALRIEPRFLGARTNLAALLAKLNRAEEARAHLDTILFYDPDCVEAYNNLGNLHCALGRESGDSLQFKEAVRLFLKGLQLDPDFSLLHTNLAVSLLELRRYREAEHELKEAIRLDPRFAGAHHNLACLYLKQERYPEAVGQFDIVVRLNPDDTSAHRNLAFLLPQLGRFEEATIEYQEVLRLTPEDVDARLKLASLLWYVGRPEQAKLHFVWARDLLRQCGKVDKAAIVDSLLRTF